MMILKILSLVVERLVEVLRTVVESVRYVALEYVWVLVNAMVTAIPNNPQTFGVTMTIVHHVI